MYMTCKNIQICILNKTKTDLWHANMPVFLPYSLDYNLVFCFLNFTGNRNKMGTLIQHIYAWHALMLRQQQLLGRPRTAYTSLCYGDLNTLYCNLETVDFYVSLFSGRTSLFVNFSCM